jgi:catalase
VPEVRTGFGGELHQLAGGDHPALTTHQGLQISDHQNSLKAKPRGPTVLEDFILGEKITHFDRTLPRSLRMMEGLGIHSFRPVNAQEKPPL